MPLAEAPPSASVGAPPPRKQTSLRAVLLVRATRRTMGRRRAVPQWSRCFLLIRAHSTLHPHRKGARCLGGIADCSIRMIEVSGRAARCADEGAHGCRIDARPRLHVGVCVALRKTGWHVVQIGMWLVGARPSPSMASPCDANPLKTIHVQSQPPASKPLSPLPCPTHYGAAVNCNDPVWPSGHGG